MVAAALLALNMATPFREIEAFAQREGLFRRVRSLLAAVSGGPDSLALLLALQDLSGRFGFSLTVAHFDHRLRPQSRDDLEFVRAICETRGIAFLSGEGDVRDAARRQRLGIEEAARRMRYQFLSFVAGEKGIDAIATGHTADDQAETVLMRVLRGAGVRGIRGMRPIATVPGGSQRLIRPLLETTRAQTLAICAAAGLTPLVDPTNSDRAILRNRVREEVIPVLEGMNPAVRDALRRLASNAAEVFAGIEREAMACQPVERGAPGAIFALPALRALSSEARALIVEREAAFFKAEVETNATRLRNLERVLLSGSGIVRFGQAEVEASCGLVRVGLPLEAVDLPEKVLDVPGVTRAGPWRVEVSTAGVAASSAGGRCAVPLAGQRGALRIRSILPGDRIRYHGMHRKVSDLLANEKVPRWVRARAAVIADAVSVRAVLAATGAFEMDRDPDADVLYVRLSLA